MPVPFVTTEVIESIRTQAMRRQGDNRLYCHDVLDDMNDENPHLADAIRDTIGLIASKCNLDPEDKRDAFLIVNISNLAMSIYSSIKQQIICDELNG